MSDNTVERKRRIAELIERLADAGELSDPHWRDAFENIPRDLFVPAYYADEPDGGCRVVTSTDPEWMEGVYSDTSLVVQSLTDPRYDRPVPTSSSTMPSLMARMLRLLELEPGQNVLEIGTATGYNAALIGFGDRGTLTSIEIDPDLAAVARDRLHSLGQNPTIIAGDGREGYAANAPYDRIIATCAADRVPGAWVSQLAPGGRIVVDVRSESASNLVVLGKTADEPSVSGRFVGASGYFMWMRAQATSPLLNPDIGELVLNHRDEGTAETLLNLGWLNDSGFRTLVGIIDPTLHLPMVVPRQSQLTGDILIYADDNSWATINRATSGQSLVTEGGPRRVWSLVERAARLWDELGEPESGRYGLTVDSDGRQKFWIDNPGRPLID